MSIDIGMSLKKFNIRPSKSLGQNFLVDREVLKTIVQSAELTGEDIVLEIGPGLGNLTAELAENAGRVVAVEIDKRLVPVLEDNLKAYKNVRIINADILRINLAEELELGDVSSGRLKIVANLPYYITTPVVMKLLESGIKARTMVFMVQKEVADRMKAAPGSKDYGALSVAVQYYSKPSVVAEVPPDSFIPRPEVYSSVIRLELYDEPPVNLRSEELFFKIVKAAFGQRRKTLVNALHNAGYFNADREEIREVLGKIGVGEMQRGETLSIDQFAELSNLLIDKIKS